MFRILKLAIVLAVGVILCQTQANPIILPDGAYIDEDLRITIQPSDSNLAATVISEFDLYPHNFFVSSILFPLPHGSRNITVYEVTDSNEIPVAWQWNTDPMYYYPTILPEEPNLPLIQWFGPWTLYTARRFKVTYEHDLINRPDEKVFLYASGVSKFPGTTQFFNVDFDVTLPAGYSATPYLDHGTMLYNLNRYLMTFSIDPAAQDFHIFKDTIIYLTPDSAKGDCDGDGVPNCEELFPSVYFTNHFFPVSRPSTSSSDYKADFNADGYLDRVYYWWFGNIITVQFADANGVYTSGQSLPAHFVQHVKTGDIDADGDMDFAAAGLTAFPDEYPRINVYLNDGTGAFRLVFQYTGSYSFASSPQALIRTSSPHLVFWYYTSNYVMRSWRANVTSATSTDINANRVPDSCEDLLPGDLDFNGVRDANDAGAFSQQWLRSDCKLPVWCSGADYDHNTWVTFVDYALFASAWASEEPPGE